MGQRLAGTGRKTPKRKIRLMGLNSLGRGKIPCASVARGVEKFEPSGELIYRMVM
jgi:hypothetical protein